MGDGVSSLEDIFALPAFTDRDGNLRYLNVIRTDPDGEMREYEMFDKYGRPVEDGTFGDRRMRIYDGENRIMTVLFYYAENCLTEKCVYRMPEDYLPENYDLRRDCSGKFSLIKSYPPTELETDRTF